jgi:hypothetical protein
MAAMTPTRSSCRFPDGLWVPSGAYIQRRPRLNQIGRLWLRLPFEGDVQAIRKSRKITAALAAEGIRHDSIRVSYDLHAMDYKHIPREACGPGTLERYCGESPRTTGCLASLHSL